MVASVPNYVVNQDYLDYTGGGVDDPTLTTLLARAEHYIDLVASARPIAVPATDTIHLLAITGVPTGGTFTIGITVDNTNYITAPIPYNAKNTDVYNALAAIPGFPGTPRVVGGPLPYLPVFVGYRGSLGGQVVAPVAAVGALTGGAAPQVSFTMSAQGGGFDKRFNLSAMEAGDIMSVKNAVCAQAQYMTLMDDRLFDEAQYTSVRGPAFTTTGRLPVVAPKARRELALAGIRFASTRSRP